MVMLGVIPPVAVWGVFYCKKVRKKSKEYMDSLANAGIIAKERLWDLKTVRALGSIILRHDPINIFSIEIFTHSSTLSTNNHNIFSVNAMKR